MKKGDKIRVINKQSQFYLQEGYITAEEDGKFRISVYSWTCRLFSETELELITEPTEKPKPKVYHLDLSLEDMNALAELGKMKDNLELLERLLKRAKGETND